MKDRLYDELKAVALIWLPALGTMYFALSQIWHLPYGPEIVGSITAVDAFLGAGLHVSTSGYNARKPSDGNIVIDRSDPKKDVYSLEMATPVEDIGSKDSITLKVVGGK